MKKSGQKIEKQLSVDDANRSRLCTKIRWVIEAYHARFKAWLFFLYRQPLSLIGHEHEVLFILSSLLNYRKPLKAADDMKDVADALEMKNRMETLISNDIFQRLSSDKRLDSRHSKQWETLITYHWSAAMKLWEGSTADSFPKLSPDELSKRVFRSPYLGRLAKSYCLEHMLRDSQARIAYGKSDEYTYEITNICSDIIRVRTIYSKHSASLKYSSYVSYDSTSITGWYCTCKVGMKTINPCCHSASVILYMSHYRHAESPVKYIHHAVIPKTDLARIQKRTQGDEFLQLPNTPSIPHVRSRARKMLKLSAIVDETQEKDKK